MSGKAPTNPFYVLLVAVGILFSVTACAYMVMAFRALHLPPAGAAAATMDERLAAADRSSDGLMGFMDRHGARLMVAELLLLAVATVAVIGTDAHWSRRAASRAGRLADGNSPHKP